MSGPVTSHEMSADSSSQAFGTQPFAQRATRERDANFRTSVINLDRPGDPNVFGAAVRTDAAELISRYPAGQARSALLPLLHLVQSEQGYVTPDGIAFCADVLDLTKAQVAAVATFYTMYKRAPTGEYLVSVCTNTLCGVLGGDEIFAALKEQLGVGNDQTTPDGKITLEHAECLAACDYAPVVTVNYEFFDNQTEASAGALVKQLQNGEKPLPTRGAPLCSFRQIERQIAGFHDAAALAPDANGAGTPTLVGVNLAIERGDTAPSYSLRDGAPAEDAPAEAADARGEQLELGSESGKPAAKQPAAKRSRSRKRGGSAQSSQTTPSAQEGPSDNDAPLETAESDPAHPTRTDTEKGE